MQDVNFIAATDRFYRLFCIIIIAAILKVKTVAANYFSGVCSDEDCI